MACKKRPASAPAGPAAVRRRPASNACQGEWTDDAVSGSQGKHGRTDESVEAQNSDRGVGGRVPLTPRGSQAKRGRADKGVEATSSARGVGGPLPLTPRGSQTKRGRADEGVEAQGSDRGVEKQSSLSPRSSRGKYGKTIRPAAAGGLCWSCKAGGLGSSCMKARRDGRNCCKGCFKFRRCSKCAEFNEALDANWCVKCETRIAMWCRACNDKELLQRRICQTCLETERKS